ncbi:unknown [Salmonella phage FelixO1]|uniref:Uncharacterized protein n=1 Tax=Salmonella phage Felix O1 (isolate Felix O1-VT1) TaxID=1283336 RepID=Q6KGI1_BPFO1|nr:unknown [Salmonella phage FelixO1]
MSVRLDSICAKVGTTILPNFIDILIPSLAPSRTIFTFFPLITLDSVFIVIP